MENNEGGQVCNHLYVPQCYLAGFAHNWGKKSQLYIVDSTVTEAFFTTLQNVAVERDFGPVLVARVENGAREVTRRDGVA